MAHAKNHDYHVLPPSIWPLFGAVAGFVMLFGAVLWMHGSGPWLGLIGLAGVLYVMYAWWAEVVHESQVGDHTPVVRLGLRYGFILFIMSEVMFFSAWFWTFFKHRLYPMGPDSPTIDGVWPPAGIETFDPWHLPFINTLILLLSGCAATWAHHALVHENNRRDLVNGLIIAIGLGVIFTAMQAYEYSHAAFGFAGNIYGAGFCRATGVRGFLVSLGFWQLRRMEEKRVYLDEIAARIGNAPIPLPAVPEEGPHKFQAVFAEGRFTGEFLEVLAGQKGASPGVMVIEAFALPDGRRIMVQRGFVEDEAHTLPRPPHEAKVAGNLHWPDDTSSSTPPPDAKTGLWFARDVPAMAAALQTEPTLIVASAPTGDGIAPMPVDTSGIPNDHWGYAIQWFLLAATWAGMTLFLLWRIRTRKV